MHEFLSSVGFGSLKTKKELNELIAWVLEKPDSLHIVTVGPEQDLAEARREVSGHAGIAVIGELDEKGDIVPEYYYPYMSSNHISSDAPISFEAQTDRDGFTGMCEDYRLGMALIFQVSNPTEIWKRKKSASLNIPVKEVNLTALASEGQILLPIEIPEKVIEQSEQAKERRKQLMENAHSGDPSAMEQIARQDIHEYTNVMQRLNETDLYTVVDTFFMPNGMDSERYYFLGKIIAKQLIVNEYTKEKFHRLLIETNDLQLVVAINDEDLTGVPEIGYRLRCRAWLQGEVH